MGEDKTDFTTLAIVAIVGVVAIFVLAINQDASTPIQFENQQAIVGAAITPPISPYSSYLDQFDYNLDGKITAADGKKLSEYIDRNNCAVGVCDLDQNKILDTNDLVFFNTYIIPSYQTVTTNNQVETRTTASGITGNMIKQERIMKPVISTDSDTTSAGSILA